MHVVDCLGMAHKSVMALPVPIERGFWQLSVIICVKCLGVLLRPSTLTKTSLTFNHACLNNIVSNFQTSVIKSVREFVQI